GVVGLALGCSSSPDVGSGDEDATEANANAALEIHPLDIWAQPIPKSDLKLTVKRGGKVVASGSGDTEVLLSAKGTYAIHAEAPNHVPLDMTFDYDGGSGTESAKVKAEEATGHGVALGHGSKTLAGRKVPTHDLYLGLRHKWFSAEGRPARRGNAV